MQKIKKHIISRFFFYTSIAIVVYMPLHVLLSTWLGTNLSILNLIKALKDVFLVFALAAVIVATGRRKIYHFSKTTIVRLIITYCVITVLFALMFNNSLSAEILGIVYNIRFMLVFLYGLLAVQFFSDGQVDKIFKSALGVGAFVAVLGLLQIMLLSDNALGFFGYSLDAGTPTKFYISEVAQVSERAFSTLKDPNSLGSYLLIISSLSIASIGSWKRLKTKFKFTNTIELIIVTGCLYYTYSRSAWIGGLFALLLFAYISKDKAAALLSSKTLKYTVFLLFLLSVGAVFMFRGSSFFQTTILHVGDAAPETSNSLRVSAYRDSLDLIKSQPLGYGVGSAGPVSFKNVKRTPIITENYYLQLAVEVGLVGLVIFMSIVVLTGRMLWVHKGMRYAKPLLMSLLGLSVAGLFVHVWSNEAVAYTWWLLAGLTLGPVFSSLQSKPKRT